MTPNEVRAIAGLADWTLIPCTMCGKKAGNHFLTWSEQGDWGDEQLKCHMLADIIKSPDLLTYFTSDSEQSYQHTMRFIS